MTTALSSLLMLIDHAQSGQMPSMEGCDNYEKSVIYAQVLRLMGFQANVAEGSFAIKSKVREETHLSLSGLCLPEEAIDFVSPHGDVGVENAMQALANRVRQGENRDDETLWISRMAPGSIPVDQFLAGLGPDDRMVQAINIGHAWLQSKHLEQHWPHSPSQARPRF